MTGHTKEPWETQPCREDGALFIIGSNLGGLVGAAHAWPTEIDSGDFSRIEANARRIVDCVNALAGSENPAAFVAAFEGMERALERIATVDMGGGFLGAQACRKVASAALQSARAARGEV